MLRFTSTLGTEIQPTYNQSMVQPELPIQEEGNGGVLSIRVPPPQPVSDDTRDDHDVH